ncbi:MAG: adenylosuccinate synthase [Clostridia bacterium]|nr:adenylosuccinate synthase [Clostridia bacterium]
MVRTIVGANWGDEGKGKITDMLAGDSDIVVRFQGGANAGHTIINEYGRFALHLLPSGVCTPGVVNILGPGVALDIEAFLTELQSLEESGVPAPKILVSERAQVMMPYHVQLDCLEEERLGKNSFGSTKSGIAPFYGDKYQKIGLQLCQLYDAKILREKLLHALDIKNALITNLYHKEPIDAEALIAKMTELAERIRPYVADTDAYLMEAVRSGKNILLEGQLGTLRDPDHGIYPMVTSSSPLAGYAPVGAGVPVWSIKEIIAVTKAYSSCVGAGPFTTELFGDEAEELRRRGGDHGEYGAKTGRPRRVGWFDCVATRYGCEMQGATEAALTNLDVLSYLDEIPVCVAYELDGQRVDRFPVTPKLERCTPVYEKLPGWRTDIRGITSFEALPENARRYVEFLERQIACPIRMVSNGPRREEIIRR